MADPVSGENARTPMPADGRAAGHVEPPPGPRGGALASVLRYLLAGALAFAFDFGLLWLLHEVLGIPLAVSTPVAFIASFVVTYTLQRVFAFRSRAAVPLSALKYGLLVMANTVLTTAIVVGASLLGMPWEAGKLVAVAATTVGNYFAYRFWVFAPGKRQD